MEEYLPQVELLTDEQHDAAVDCCLGAHKEVWYKFKRFEDLSLLNLYYYQHQLVLLDKKTFGQFFGERLKNPNFERQPLDDRAWAELRRYLKGYQEALQLFKQTQQLKRPTFADREEALKVLSQRMREDHYLEGHDSKSMLDIGPGALGVRNDNIRAKLEVVGEQLTRPVTGYAHLHPHPHDTEAQHDSHHHHGHESHHTTPTYNRSKRIHRLPDNEQERFRRYSFAGRPYQVPENPAVDRIIQFVVAIIAAACLLVPLLTLSYIRQRDYTIMATCLFVILFAFMVSMISRASTTEVMVAVATYAAVLVVFVGQTIAPPS